MPRWYYKIQIGYSTYTLIYKYPDESTIIPAVKVNVNKVWFQTKRLPFFLSLNRTSVYARS